MKIGIASHKASANVAGIRAVTTGLDALSHHLHHIAIETSGGAVFTFTQTIETRFDASVKLRLMRLGSGHNLSPRENNKGTKLHVLGFHSRKLLARSRLATEV